MTRSLPSISDLLQRTWNRYWSQVGTLLLISLFVVVAGFLIDYAALGKAYSLYAVGAGADSEIPELSLRIVVISSLVSIFLNVLGTSLTVSALLTASSRLRELLPIVRRSYLPLLATNFLIGLITLAGLALFIVPGILAILWFLFSDFAVIVEQHSVRSALRRSRELVRGIAWAIFARLMAYGIVAVILTIILSYVPFGTSISTIVISPFTTVFLFELYRAARANTNHEQQPNAHPA
jgi:hypothetical protein